MRNIQAWRPSKFVYRQGRLRASPDPAEVAPGSRLMAGRIAEFYHQRLPTYARGELLDLGCGQVPLFQSYRERVSGVTCIDWQHCRHEHCHLDQEWDLNQPLPVADAQFDTVILSDVLEHVTEPQQLITEIARVLKPKGHLLLNVPFFYCIHERPYDYYRYTEFALRRFMLQAGLTVEELTPLGGSLEVMADMLAKHLQFIPLVGSMLASCVVWITQALCGLTPLKRFSGKSAEAFPYGYALVARKPVS